MSDVFVRTLHVDRDHPAFDGHFPGQPILPGVALLAEVLEAGFDEPAIAAGLGATPRLLVAKFFAPVAPGASLAIEWRTSAKTLDWRVADGTRDVASGQFAHADAATAASS